MDTKNTFFQLAKQYEEQLEALKSTKEQLQSIMKDLGEGTYLQDPGDMTVYNIVVPKGTYVTYNPIDYIRTRKLNEDRGDLSLTKAEENGFSVEHLKRKKS
jgi:hypothetical protein